MSNGLGAPCLSSIVSRMSTPQQFLQSFLQTKAAVYAEANVRLVPLYTKYFGDRLSNYARDFLLRDKVEAAFEEVKQSGDSAIIITREHFASDDIRTRYHLAAVGESWKIIRIDRECFLCHGTGRSQTMICRKCEGEGWYDSRKNAG